MSRSRSLPLSLLAVLALLFSACGGDQPSTTEAAGAPDKGIANPTAHTPDEKPTEADRVASKDAPNKDTGEPPENKPKVDATWRGDGTAIEFNAWKMGCSGCGNTVRKRIGGIDGVKDVQTRVDRAFIQVELDDAAKREAVIAQITKVLETPETGRKFMVIRAGGNK